MKQLNLLTTLFFVISLICLSICSVNAQDTDNTKHKSDKKISIKANGKNYYFNALALKDGKTQTKMSDGMDVEFTKKRGKIVSIRMKKSPGKWSPNMLSVNSGEQKYNCHETTCVCVGDEDCNLMMSANVCRISGKGPFGVEEVDGSCTDDYPTTCTCNTN